MPCPVMGLARDVALASTFGFQFNFLALPDRVENYHVFGNSRHSTFVGMICWFLVSIFTLFVSSSESTSKFHSFVKTYGSSNDERQWHLSVTSDGGFITVGSQDSFWRHARITKFNADGEMEFYYLFGKEDPSYKTHIRFIRELSDGDYVFVGYSYEDVLEDEEPFIAKMHPNGTVVWVKTCTWATDGFVYSFEVLRNGKFLISGSFLRTGEFRGCVLRVDSSGDFEAATCFRKVGGHVSIYFGFETVNGDIIIGGWDHSDDAFLARLDSNLQIIDSDQAYDMGTLGWLEEGFELPNGDIILAGHNFIGYFSPDLSATLWQLDIAELKIKDHVVVDNSTFIFITENMNDGRSINIMCFNVTGTGSDDYNLIWNREIDSTVDEDINTRGVGILEDGGLILGGSSPGFSTVSGRDAFIIKTRSDGTGCAVNPEMSGNWEMTDHTFSISSTSLSDRDEDMGTFSDTTSQYVCLDMTDEVSNGTQTYCSQCMEGRYGLDCEVSVCYGVMGNETNEVCQGRGNCTAVDVCSCHDEYFGEYCNITTCNGVLSNFSSIVCSGRGICQVFERCECTEDYYYGEACNVTTCEGIFSNDTIHACSSSVQGRCVDLDICECKAGYHGTICNITECFGILNNESTSEQCYGHGVCTPPRCNCDTSYFSSECNVTLCDGVFGNDTENVCGGHGICWPQENCTCVEDEGGYFGSFCNLTFCNGIPSSSTESCGDHGSCWPYEHCNCVDDWFGNSCNITTCGQFFSNESSDVCTGHGICSDHETCNCFTNYYGQACNITICNSLYSNDTEEVCKGHGSCVYWEECTCDDYYYFSADNDDCEVTVCDGRLSNITETCGLYGKCWPYGECGCEDGYFNWSPMKECNITSCDGIFSNDTNVCSTHGSCWPKDYCSCFDGYYGERCNITTCFEIWGNDTDNVCGGGHGSCESEDVCQCFEHYYGANCNISECFDVLANYTDSVCSKGRGVCSDYNVCECFGNYYGEECSITTCFDKFSNDSSTVCSGSSRGNCIDFDDCECSEVYYNGSECQFSFCNSIFGNDTSVCSEHGICVDLDTCSCYEDYYGEDCNISSCFGVLSNYTDEVCSFGKGRCILHDRCDCLENYYGASCDVTTCSGILSNETNTTKFCQGRALECLDFDLCRCKPGYNGTLCEIPSCDGISSLEYDVCSRHGGCVDLDKCECFGPYTGEFCNLWTCEGISLSNASWVCGGHGACIDLDRCSCMYGYEASVEFGACDIWYCGFPPIVYTNSRQVCSGRGTCVDSNDCECRDDYEGEYCETWSCGSFEQSEISIVCSGRGECVEPNTCQCQTGYVGNLCQTNTYLYTVMAPVLGTTGLFFLLFMLSVVACGCCYCLLCIVVSCLASTVLVCVVCQQRTGIRKFRKLRNFEILLQEQELEDDDTVAKLKFNKKLFEIPFEEIRTISILGEGGSNSCVFKAVWKGQKCAFKCFKTRNLTNSQDNFDEFEREVEILSSLAHPNIIRFYGATLKPPRVGILMELCSKGELLEFVTQFRNKYSTRYPMGEKLRLLTECASAIDYIHSRSIIHRDLKSENVLISGDSRAKLMDFGLSRLVDAASQKTKRVGTSFYIIKPVAPEIVLAGNYDEKCDVFSFAILMVILISEESRPYGTGNDAGIEIMVANDPNYRPNLEKLLKSDPEVLPREYEWLEKVIRKCWDHEASQRYSIREIRDLFSKKMDNLDNDEVMMEEEEEDQEVIKDKKEKREKDDRLAEADKKRIESLEVENAKLRERISKLEEEEDILEGF